MSEKETEKVLTAFKTAGADFTLKEHEPVLTSKDAARVRGSLLKQGVKALVIKIKKPEEFVIVNVPADKRVNLKKVKQILNVNRLTIATPKEALYITGCEVGSVPPLGHKNNLKILVDETVFDNDFNEFNIGQKTVSAKIKTSDLKKVFEKQQALICKIKE